MKAYQQNEKDRIGRVRHGQQAGKSGGLETETPKITGGSGNDEDRPFHVKNMGISKTNEVSGTNRHSEAILIGLQDSNEDHLQEYGNEKLREEMESLVDNGFEGQSSEGNQRDDWKRVEGQKGFRDSKDEANKDKKGQSDWARKKETEIFVSKSVKKEHGFTKGTKEINVFLRTGERNEIPLENEDLDEGLRNDGLFSNVQNNSGLQDNRLQPRYESSMEVGNLNNRDASQREARKFGKPMVGDIALYTKIGPNEYLNSKYRHNLSNPVPQFSTRLSNSQRNSVARHTKEALQNSLKKGPFLSQNSPENQAIPHNQLRRLNDFEYQLPSLATDDRKQGHLPAHIHTQAFQRNSFRPTEEFSENVVFTAGQFKSQDISEKYVYSRPPTSKDTNEGSSASKYEERYSRPVSGVQSFPRSKVASLDKQVRGRGQQSDKDSRSGSRLNDSGLGNQKLVALKERYRAMEDKFESTSTSGYLHPAKPSYGKRNELRDILARQNADFTSIHSKPQLGMKLKEGFLSRDISLKRQLKMERRNESNNFEREYLPSLKPKLNLHFSNENSVGETSLVNRHISRQTPSRAGPSQMVSKGVGKSSTSKTITPAYLSSFYKDKRTEHVSGQVTPVSRFPSIEDSPHSASKLQFATPYNLTKSSSFRPTVQAPQKAMALVRFLDADKKMAIEGLGTVHQRGMDILKELNQYLGKLLEKASRQIFISQSQGVLAGAGGKAVSRKHTFMSLKCAKDHSTNTLTIASLEKELEKCSNTYQDNSDPHYGKELDKECRDLVEQIEECRKEIIKSSKQARLTSTASEESLQRKLILNSQLWKAKELELLGKNLENTKSSQKILEDKIHELEDRIRVYEEEEQAIERRIVHAKAEINDMDILRKDKIYSGFSELNKNYERLAEEMDIAARSVKTKMGGRLREVDALINDNKLMAKKGEELDYMLQQQLAVIQQLVSEQEKKQTDKTKEKLEHIAKVESMKLEWMTKLANCTDKQRRDSQSTGKQSKTTKERSPKEIVGKNGREGFHDASQGVDLLDEEEDREDEGSYERSEERVATREEKWSEREDRGSAKLVILS